MNVKTTDNLTYQLEDALRRIRCAGNDAEAMKVFRELIDTQRLDAVTRLAAWVSHKINNPLATISGNAQLLARRLERDIEDPDKLQSYLKYTDGIRGEIERCARIACDLMDFVHPDTNLGTDLQSVPNGRIRDL